MLGERTWAKQVSPLTNEHLCVCACMYVYVYKNMYTHMYYFFPWDSPVSSCSSHP